MRPVDPIDGVIDTDEVDHPCTQNYDGSSGAMESNGILLLMKQLQKKYNGEIYLDYIITDDDTKMKNTLLIRNIYHGGRKILAEAYQSKSLSLIGTPTQHIEQSVWQAVFLNYAKGKSQILEQISLMHSA